MLLVSIEACFNSEVEDKMAFLNIDLNQSLSGVMFSWGSSEGSFKFFNVRICSFIGYRVLALCEVLAI